MKSDEYRCAYCKNVYTKGWTEEEALEEKEEVWGGIPVEACVLVCDDCWNEMHPDKPENALLKALTMEELFK